VQFYDFHPILGFLPTRFTEVPSANHRVQGQLLVDLPSLGQTVKMLRGSCDEFTKDLLWN